MRSTALIFSGYFVSWGVVFAWVLLGIDSIVGEDVGNIAVCLVPIPLLLLLAGAVFLHKYLGKKANA